MEKTLVIKQILGSVAWCQVLSRVPRSQVVPVLLTDTEVACSPFR